MLSLTCLDQATRSCRQEHRRERKRTQAGPEKERGKKKEEEERRTDKPRNSGPRVPRTARKKNSLNQISKSIQKHTPGTSENTSNTNHGARCPKPSAKTRRNKNRTPEKPKSGRIFSSPFSGRKKGHFWAKKLLSTKTRTPRSELVAKNSPRKT